MIVYEIVSLIILWMQLNPLFEEASNAQQVGIVLELYSFLLLIFWKVKQNRNINNLNFYKLIFVFFKSFWIS
jgi:hypothetical protein